ncbi:Alpha/Beta hydrolase protein [Aspergillus pseudoustus]|uniref:Alpha/Beta hydrolase protein n=1 Tax=Aspergillus pseudoustus TaxID=1810923 RepID=A0ABR4IVT1_9EURO
MSSLFFSTAPATDIHVRVTRPDTHTEKPLLVFLHYWGGSSSTWYKLTSTKGQTPVSFEYPTAAIDLRGWGKSAHQAEGEGQHSISAMAADVASVLSQLEQQQENKSLLAHDFVLVGHSMGAKVGVASLSNLAAPLLAKLKGIVLVAPAPPTALILPPEMKEQQKVAYESEESVRWTVTNVLANAAKLDDKDMQTVVRDSLSGTALAKAAWPSYGMEEDISQDVKWVIASSVSGLRVRVLAGESDIVEPRDRVEKEVVQFLKDAGADVSLRVVEDVKHLIPLESPEAVYEEVTSF